jgi:hypothetical protein
VEWFELRDTRFLVSWDLEWGFDVQMKFNFWNRTVKPGREVGSGVYRRFRGAVSGTGRDVTYGDGLSCGSSAFREI